MAKRGSWTSRNTVLHLRSMPQDIKLPRGPVSPTHHQRYIPHRGVGSCTKSFGKFKYRQIQKFSKLWLDLLGHQPELNKGRGLPGEPELVAGIQQDNGVEDL